MKVGFIGAGKVGCSLGAYFVHQGIQVVGFVSRSDASAEKAAKLTHTKHIVGMNQLITMCDVLFLTVSDDSIASVWNQVSQFSIQGKIICHCSGSLSSTVFSRIENTGAYGYSVHPMFPFQSKTTSYEELSQAVISVEGNPLHKDVLLSLLSKLPNSIIHVSTQNKTRYHAAAVFASNLVVGLMEEALLMLESCGFTREEALQAISPLAKENMNHIMQDGPAKALTGPVERCDTSTIEKHLQVLSKEEKEVYLPLTKKLISIAKEKHKETDYNEMQKILEEENETNS